MMLRTELEALRGEYAPRRQAQAQVQDRYGNWLARGPFAGLEGEFHAFARGAQIESLPLLVRLFTRGDPLARQLADGLSDWFSAELAEDPLAMVPIQHYHDDVISSLALFAAAGATLALTAYDGAGLSRRAAATAISFAPGESHEHLLAGELAGCLVELRHERPEGADLAKAPCRLKAGTVSSRDSARQALLVTAVPGILVTLKLQRRPTSGAVAREFALADGALLRQAAASARESRLELSAGLLGRMERNEAAPVLAAMAEEEGGQSLRWQSLKECLGLDTALGFATLTMIAGKRGDPLAGPAAALRSQLLATYPQLAGAAKCPV